MCGFACLLGLHRPRRKPPNLATITISTTWVAINPSSSATEATEKLQFYGDPTTPGYQDRLPVDGIDDQRGRRLRLLAAKFSPILYRNNFSVPIDFKDFLQDTSNHKFLFIDTWKLSGGKSERIQADSIDIGAVSPPILPENGHSGGRIKKAG